VSVLAPKISSVSPGEGAPGWLVTVTGHNFTGVTRVTFGGVAARFTIQLVEDHRDDPGRSGQRRAGGAQLRRAGTGGLYRHPG
jgi:hypothetical protein